MLEDTLVHFECVSTRHKAGAASGCWGGLVVNRGRWSYCDGLGAGEDHVWVATGGVTYGTLLRKKANLENALDGPRRPTEVEVLA